MGRRKPALARRPHEALTQEDSTHAKRPDGLSQDVLTEGGVRIRAALSPEAQLTGCPEDREDRIWHNHDHLGR